MCLVPALVTSGPLAPSYTSLAPVTSGPFAIQQIDSLQATQQIDSLQATQQIDSLKATQQINSLQVKQQIGGLQYER